MLWAIWEMCAGDFVSHVGRQHPEVFARFYSDFLIDNADLVSELGPAFSSVDRPSMEMLCFTDLASKTMLGDCQQ